MILRLRLLIPPQHEVALGLPPLPAAPGGPFGLVLGELLGDPPAALLVVPGHYGPQPLEHPDGFGVVPMMGIVQRVPVIVRQLAHEHGGLDQSILREHRRSLPLCQ